MDPKLADSIWEYAVRFCNARGNSSSVCYPLSAQTVLALTALGCAGASRSELLAALGFSDDKAVRSSLTYLTSTMSSIEGVSLRIADRMFVTKNGTLKPAIQKDAINVINTGQEQLDFRDNVAAAAAINKWVADQTAGMMENAIAPGSLKADTALELVNAVYFQGRWEYPLLTGDMAFHVNNTTEIKVPMMWETDTCFRYKHSSKLRAKILRMNYEGRQASMVIVLPDEVEGLGDVMQQLAAGHDLMDEVAKLWEVRLDVMIPKFKVEMEINLKQLLPKMGIKSVVDKRKSEIQMLTSNQRLYVSEAVQKAVIEVDEAGTKAAACTYAGDEFCCKKWRPPEKLKFISDCPFLCMLTQQMPQCQHTRKAKSSHCRTYEPCRNNTLGSEYKDHIMHRPCSADYRPPKRRKFIANRPFLYLVTTRQIPMFMGIYDGSEFGT